MTIFAIQLGNTFFATKFVHSERVKFTDAALCKDCRPKLLTYHDNCIILTRLAHYWDVCYRTELNRIVIGRYRLQIPIGWFVTGYNRFAF